MKKILLLVLSSFLLLHSRNAHAQDCPNGDFENWNIISYQQPDSGWYTSNPQTVAVADSLTVWPVPGFSGQAVHIQTAIVGTDTLMAYITNEPGNPQSGMGGVPYSQQPTAITGYYRYHMVGGDSAILFVLFKKAGIPLSINQYTISNPTGSVSTFTAFSLPISALAIAPDSVIIAASSSNVFGSGLQSGSWLEMDQLAFSGPGITQPIPGGSFDTWTADSVFNPAGWNVQQAGQNGNGVTRSASHYSGNYSVELVSQPSGGGGGGPVSPAQMTTGWATNMGPTGGLPYTRTSDTLTGYYKYIAAATDTGVLQVSLSAAGTPVGGNGHYFLPAATWTYFSVPFSAGSTPDSMRIDIGSDSYAATVPGSTLYLDYLQLSSQPLPPLTTNHVIAAPEISAYPNPANDVLNIRSDDFTGPVTAKIYNMMGQILDSRQYDTPVSMITFQVGYLPAGLYFYEVVNNGSITRSKFMKQ